MVILPVIAVIISFILSAMVLKQYIERRKTYQLMWGIGFSMFTLASIAEVVALFAGWNLFLLQVYYLFGATLLVGYLGLGTIHLLWSGSIAKISTVIVIILSIISVVLILQAKTDSSNLEKVNTRFQSSSEIAKEAGLESEKDDAKLKIADALVKHSALRIITAFLNIIGSLVLIGGAVYSAVISVLNKKLDSRFIGTALIAAGAFIIASGGTMSGIAGVSGQIVLSATITIGIVVMFIGFLFTNKQTKTA